MMRTHYLKNVAGFTLVETLVVISLMTIIAGLSLGSDLTSYQHGLAHTDRELTLAALREARAESTDGTCLDVTCTTPVAHGVALFSNHLTLFEGPDYDNRTIAVDQVIPFSSKEVLSSTSAASVVFASQTADVSEPITILLAGNDAQIETISINTDGAISSSLSGAPSSP